MRHASAKTTADINGARAKRNTDVAAGYITRLFGAPSTPTTPTLALTA